MSEQKNFYLGRSGRPWLKLDFLTVEGAREELALVADTGCPFDLVLAPEVFDRLSVFDLPALSTNFGELLAGRIRLYMPEMGIDRFLVALRSETVGSNLAAEHPDFSGLVGLPFLRLGEYGGDPSSFYFRYPPHSHFTQEDHEQPQA